MLIPALAGSFGLFFYFLAQFPGYLPVDDSYICLSFARNIVEHGELFSYNVGELSTGITSPLYASLLALSYLITHEWHAAVLVLGMISFCVALAGMMRIAWQIAGHWALLFVVCFFGFSGHMAYFSLFGMEPMVYIGLAVWGISFFLQGNVFISGCLIGLSMLCRPEAIFLAFVVMTFIGGQFLWVWIVQRDRRQAVQIAISGAFFMLGFCLCVFPWILRCLQVSGTVFSSTVAMKTNTGVPFTQTLKFWVDAVRMIFPDNCDYKITEKIMHPTVYMQFRKVVPLSLIAFLSLWGLRRSLKSALLLLYIPVHLFVAGMKNAACSDNERYLSLDYAVTYLYLAVLFAQCLTVSDFCPAVKRVWRRVVLVLAAGLIGLIIADYSWHIKTFHVKASYFCYLDYQIGLWLAKNTSPAARVALYQAGGIKFFGNRYIIDGGGVSEHTIWKYLKSGTFAQALIDRKADYIASFGDDWLMSEGISMQDTRFFKQVPIQCRGLYQIIDREGLAEHIRKEREKRNKGF